MIYYEPNKNWFKDILHLTTSYTVKKIFFGVGIIGVLATVNHLLISIFNLQPSVNTTIFSLLGIVLSILLVFRTNSAYDRWWEGRKQWGALVNTTRNLAIQAHVVLPPGDNQNRYYLATHISNFCIALRDHLRNHKDLHALFLTDMEKKELDEKKHIPNHIAYWIYNCIYQSFQKGNHSTSDLINIKPNHEALIDILGACERIRKTPIPFSYAVYIKIFITAYGMILPYGLYHDFGWFSIPMTMFVFFAMLGIELIAQEIEEPFGLDCNDLPTGDIATTIKNNVFEILQGSEINPKMHEKELYQKVF